MMNASKTSWYERKLPQPWDAMTNILVVAVICVILAGMIPWCPTLAREKARRANCLAQLRQIGLAISMYTDDHDGRCPVNVNELTATGCFKLLSNEITNARIFTCPSANEARPDQTLSKLGPSNQTYSYVPFLHWQEFPDSPIALDRMINMNVGSTWPVDGNHKDAGGSVLFCDGHAEFQTTLQTALKTRDGRLIVLGS